MAKRGVEFEARFEGILDNWTQQAVGLLKEGLFTNDDIPYTHIHACWDLLGNMELKYDNIHILNALIYEAKSKPSDSQHWLTEAEEILFEEKFEWGDHVSLISVGILAVEVEKKVPGLVKERMDKYNRHMKIRKQSGLKY